MIEEDAAAGVNYRWLADSIFVAHDETRFALPGYNAGTKIYRAVKVDVPPKTKARLSYPPPQFVKMRARANLPEQPMFYGCIGSSAACFAESRARVGDTFAIGRWRTTRTLKFWHFGYSGTYMSAVPKERWSGVWQSHVDIAPRSALLRDWEAKIFTEEVSENDPHKYAVSSAMAQVALKDDQRVDGIMYPSVAVELASDNVALRPEVADTALELEAVQFERVTNIHRFGLKPGLQIGDYIGYTDTLILATSDEVTGAGDLVWTSPRKIISDTIPQSS